MLNWLRQLSPGYPHIRSDFLITNLLLRNTFMRNMIAHRRLGYMGDGSKIDFQVNIQNASNVKIGKKVKIQNGSFLSAGTGPDRSISIGDYTLAAGNIIIITSNYDIRTGLEGYIRDYPMRKGPVEIGEGAVIGWHSIILPNIKIGNKAIIKPFSVVTEDVADNEIWQAPQNDPIGR